MLHTLIIFKAVERCFDFFRKAVGQSFDVDIEEAAHNRRRCVILAHATRHQILNFFGVNAANGSFVAHLGVAGLRVQFRNGVNITLVAQHQAVTFKVRADAFNLTGHAAAVNNFTAGGDGARNGFSLAAFGV